MRSGFRNETVFFSSFFSKGKQDVCGVSSQTDESLDGSCADFMLLFVSPPPRHTASVISTQVFLLDRVTECMKTGVGPVFEAKLVTSR